MRISLTALFLCLSVAGSVHAAPPAGTNWVQDLSRSDEFDGTSLDTSRWTSGPLWYSSTGGGWPFEPSNGFVSGGNLNLRAVNGSPLTVAAVHSNFLIPGNSYVEVRAKALPKAANILTAIWVQGPYTEATNPNIEIDIQETFHYDGVESNLHVWDTVRGHIGDGVAHEYFPPPPMDVSADFHVYGLERRPDVLRIYFDGTMVWEARPSTPNYYTQDRWLIFSLEGHLGNPNTQFLPAVALVDYVRLYTVSTASPITFEAESLTRTSSAAGTNVSTGDCQNSNCGYVQLPTPSAVGDWIELTLPNIAAGIYDAKMYFKSNNSRGINQARIDGVNQGAPCDEYATTAGYQAACSLGSAISLTAGNHQVRFSVTGKNASSTGYGMTIDKIVLTPKTSGGGTGGTSGTGGAPGTGGIVGTGGVTGTGGATGTGGSTSTPVTYEAESLTRTSSAVGTNVSTGDCANSNCAYVQFAGTAKVGDYIELTLPSLAAGTYDFKMYYKSNNNRGIHQASIDGVDQGTACNEYAAGAAPQVLYNLGSKTFATTASHKLRFSVTGKATASSGYSMTLDKIVLTRAASGLAATAMLEVAERTDPVIADGPVPGCDCAMGRPSPGIAHFGLAWIGLVALVLRRQGRRRS